MKETEYPHYQSESACYLFGECESESDLIIEENTIYEIDPECLKQKKKKENMQ